MKDSSRSTLSEVGQACRRPRATSSTNLVRFRLMDGSLLESEVRHSSRKERPRSARSLSARWGTARARPRRSSTQLSEATEKKTQTERTCDENKRLEMSRRLSPKRTEPLSGYPQRGTRTHERREAKASVLLISAPHRPRKPRGRGPKKKWRKKCDSPLLNDCWSFPSDVRTKEVVLWFGTHRPPPVVVVGQVSELRRRPRRLPSCAIERSSRARGLGASP